MNTEPAGCNASLQSRMQPSPRSLHHHVYVGVFLLATVVASAAELFDFSRPFAHKLYMPITYMLAPIIATLYPNVHNDLKEIDIKRHTLYSPSFIHIDHTA